MGFVADVGLFRASSSFGGSGGGIRLLSISLLGVDIGLRSGAGLVVMLRYHTNCWQWIRVFLFLLLYSVDIAVSIHTSQFNQPQSNHRVFNHSTFPTINHKP